MERLAFGIYLFVLIISPLLFGAVHAYAYSLVFFLILSASLLLAVSNIRRDYRSGNSYIQYPETGLNFLYFAIFLLLIIQILPQPEFLVKFLSPRAYEVKSTAFELTGRQETMSLAPYLYPVRMSLLRWTAYGLFFLGLSQVLNSRKRIEILCFTLLITAGFVSIYGIYQAYLGDSRIWWFSGYGGDVRGTHINRNHFAGFMAMALMLAASLASSLRTSFYRHRSNSSVTTNDTARTFLSDEQVFSKRAFIIFFGVIIGLGLVLSASRGGIISAALGLLLMGILYVARQSQRRSGFIVLALFVLIGAYGLQVGLDHTIDRFQTEQLQSSLEGRYRYAQKTLDVFKDYQLVGVGGGNFQHAYPRYQAPEDKGYLIDYAHNDWAQLLAETGFAGLVITGAGICLFLFLTARQWQARKDHKAVALGVLPFAMLATMGVHSWLDFNMHIPANVLALVAILAIGQAALMVKARRHGHRFELGFKKVELHRRGIVLTGVIFLILAWNLGWTIRHFAAEIYCNTVPNSTMNRDKNPPAADILRAIGWDRYNAGYWHKLAQARRSERKDQKTYLPGMIEAFENAVRLNPFGALYYLDLGWAYTQQWQQSDFKAKWLPRADRAMELAGLYSGARDPLLHTEVAMYWLMRTKTLEKGTGEWDVAMQKVAGSYRQALGLLSGNKRDDLVEDIRETVWGYYPDPEIVERIVGSDE